MPIIVILNSIALIKLQIIATLPTGARTASVIPRFRPIVYIILTSVSHCGQKNLITAKISSPLTIQISRLISTISQIL